MLVSHNFLPFCSAPAGLYLPRIRTEAPPTQSSHLLVYDFLFSNGATGFHSQLQLGNLQVSALLTAVSQPGFYFPFTCIEIFTYNFS